jgi:hypothetical protein
VIIRICGDKHRSLAHAVAQRRQAALTFSRYRSAVKTFLCRERGVAQPFDKLRAVSHSTLLMALSLSQGSVERPPSAVRKDFRP